jgi:hypothetical protein
VKARPWPTPDGPELTWSTENAGSVLVEGDGFSSTAPSGSVRLCPTGGSGSFCFPSLGTHVYRMTVRDGAGAVVLTVDKVLVVVGP